MPNSEPPFSSGPMEGLLLLPYISLSPHLSTDWVLKPAFNPDPSNCSHLRLAAALGTSPCLSLVSAVQMPLTSS